MENVRLATLKDLDFIVTSQRQMALETENITLDLATISGGVEAVLKDPHKGTYYIALDNDGIPAGMLLAIPEWSDWRNGTILWIHSVYVTPRARNQGLYKRLYLHLKNKVESSNAYRGLRLYVDRRNQSAQRVYEKLGMSKEHYEMYEWLK